MLKKLARKIEGHWRLVLSSLAFIAYVINVLIFYPGYMSSDSINMVQQAMGSRPSDLAPPAMSMIWRALYTTTGAISSMLIIQLALLWGALLLLSIYVFKTTKSKKLSFLPLIIGILPFVINISGVMWRDNQMTFALVLAVVITLYMKFIKSKRWRAVALSLVILLIFYAAAVRYNAMFAIVPLIFLAVKCSELIIKLRWQIILTLFLSLFTIYGVFPLVNVIMNPIKSNPTVLLMLDDIGNVPNARELSDLPMSKPVKDILTNVKQCTDEKSLLLGVFWTCTDGVDRNNLQYRYASDVKNVWLEMVVKYPLKYISYRSKTYFVFLFPSENSSYVWENGITSNKEGQKVQFDQLGSITSKYVNKWGYRYFTFLFVPWFWLVVGIGLLISTRRRYPHRFFVGMLSLSSVLYILGYIPTGATVDYRYIYWSVLASLICLVLLQCDKYYNKKKC